MRLAQSNLRTVERPDSGRCAWIAYDGEMPVKHLLLLICLCLSLVTPVAHAAPAASVGLAAEVCQQPFTPIYQIQGRGSAAAITGAVTTQGVVMGDYELPGGTGQIRGFYLQDLTGDGDAATSDGIFVFDNGADNVTLGQVVRVSGHGR